MTIVSPNLCAGTRDLPDVPLLAYEFMACFRPPLCVGDTKAAPISVFAHNHRWHSAPDTNQIAWYNPVSEDFCRGGADDICCGNIGARGLPA
jgi:hypothetical protein